MTLESVPVAIASEEMAVAKKIFNLESLKKEFSDALVALRALPDDYVDPNSNETKDQLITEALREIDKINSELEALRIEESSKPEAEVVPPTHDITNSSLYIDIDGVYIPICQPDSQKRPTWHAFYGRTYVGGEKIFANVGFQKPVGLGVNATLHQGEEIPFGSKKGERVPGINHILEGSDGVEAFDYVLKLFGALQAAYDALNPDDQDYDSKATDLAKKMQAFLKQDSLTAFLTDTNFSEFMSLDNKRFIRQLADIFSTQKFLQEFDSKDSDFVPKNKGVYKQTPFFKTKLKEFAELINRQLGLGNNKRMELLVSRDEVPDWKTLRAKGMTVVVGPRGTGKNLMVEHYCAVSNRPLFRYACSPDKTEPELTYAVTLKDGEVVKIPSRILVAVTTPDAMLELDEINLLDPAVAKFFNSLLDHDRALFLDNEVIKAAPGVAIVGLMNPAFYEGTENLPETIDDRANAMRMGYAPLYIKDTAGNDIASYDEAMFLRSEITPLAQISDSDFIGIWNKVVNEDNVTDIDPTIVVIVKDLSNMLKIIEKVRKIVDQYKTRIKTDLKMDREISYRGSIEAARFYSEKHLWETNISQMESYEKGWDAAAYALARTYLPHTDTYRKGTQDSSTLREVIVGVLSKSTSP